MIKSDEQGNLYTFIDNDGYFKISGIQCSGTARVVIKGDEEVIKEYPASNEVCVELTNDDIQNIGVGNHLYYVDVINEDHKDTVVFQQFVVAEKGK